MPGCRMSGPVIQVCFQKHEITTKCAKNTKKGSFVFFVRFVVCFYSRMAKIKKPGRFPCRAFVI